MKIKLGELRKLIKATINENYGEPLNWEDHFSNDRETGRENVIEEIMEKLRLGQSISPREVEMLESELSGER